MSIENLTIGGTHVEVHRKKIKNLHVGVYPPDGRVRVAAPDSISTDAQATAVPISGAGTAIGSLLRIG